MTRQQEIRKELNFQYQHGAVAPGTVARLRNEMSYLAHQHRYGFPTVGIEECMYCDYWRAVKR